MASVGAAHSPHTVPSFQSAPATDPTHHYGEIWLCVEVVAVPIGLGASLLLEAAMRDAHTAAAEAVPGKG